MQINFAKDCWKETELTTAYSFRFTETPRFTQEADHVRTAVNPDHREGYDNISMLTKDTYTAGATATLHCAFEGLGCPEIILVEKVEECEDGAMRYGACFEIVLWKNGINVWRHYREEGKCFWHLRMGLEYSRTAGEGRKGRTGDLAQWPKDHPSHRGCVPKLPYGTDRLRRHCKAV